MIVAINKLEMVDWSDSAYFEIVREVQPYLNSIGFKNENLHFVPISGLHGTNLIERPTDIPELNWYQGESLTQILDELKLPKRNIHKPLRVSIYDYFKATEGNLIGDCISAKIESGVIKEKDHLILMPLNI